MYCKNCGANVGDAKFCPVCGKRITGPLNGGNNQNVNYNYQAAQNYRQPVQPEPEPENDEKKKGGFLKEIGDGIVGFIVVGGILLLLGGAYDLLFGSEDEEETKVSSSEYVSSYDDYEVSEELKEGIDRVVEDIVNDSSYDNGYTYYDDYDYNVPGPHDLAGTIDIVYPYDWAWNSEYEYKYVKSEHGVRIYLLYGPDRDYYAHFDYIDEGEEVIELAKQNGYSLVICNAGMIGWCRTELLVYCYY